jgi:hypothetical protein
MKSIYTSVNEKLKNGNGILAVNAFFHSSKQIKSMQTKARELKKH